MNFYVERIRPLKKSGLEKAKGIEFLRRNDSTVKKSESEGAKGNEFLRRKDSTVKKVTKQYFFKSQLRP